MAEFKPGDLINNRYEIVRRLGSGAMGCVYQATDLVESKIQVALKVLLSENLEDQDLWAKGEYEALTRLRHPNLARVYDFGRIQGTHDYYIVSEYIKGTDLHAATEYSSYEELCDIVVQVCRALEYIHSQGYVHFDIKPDNILVTRHRCATTREGSKVRWAVECASEEDTYTKPNAKLIDFGLAEKITGSFDFAIKGTLHYLAPEMINGGTPDRRADLYSLGVTLYQIANRELPFRHEGSPTGRTLKRSELFEKHMKKLPEFLRNVMLRLLAERPEERFQSAKEVIEAISEGSGKYYELETKETKSSYLHASTLIGRHQEFGQLKEFARSVFPQVRSRMGEGVSAGVRPPLIMVSGEIGAGKSRLVEEFHHFLKLSYVQVYAGNCYDGQNSAYQPFVEILKQLSVYVGRDSPTVQRYRDALLRLLPEFRTAADSYTFRGLRPDQEKLYFIDRIVRFLVEAAREQPYALILNNVHWADEMTIELLGYFLQNIVEEDALNPEDPLPILVIATLRMDEKIPASLRQLLALVREEKTMTEIVLKRFKHKRVRELISATLHMTAIPDAFISCVAEKTGGNPLFIVETLKALQEAGVIRTGLSGWEVATDDFRKIDIPTSMELALLRRMENLEVLGRELIEILTVGGRPVSPALLNRWPRLSQAPVLQHLRELEEKGFITSSLSDGEEIFSLDQPSFGEIIYDHLEADRRRQLHGEFADVLTEAYKDREDEVLEELAYHCRQSEKTEQALELARRAGDRLKRIYANEKAYEYYSYVADTLEEQGPEDRRWLEANECLAELCLTLGRYDQAVNLYNLLLGPEVGPRLSVTAEARYRRQRGKAYEIRGDYDRALLCYKEARDLVFAEKEADENVQLERIWAINALGGLYVQMGKYAKAMKVSIEALRIIESLGETIEHAVVFSTIGKANYFTGNLSQAIEFHRRSLEIEEKLDDAPETILTLNSLGESYQASADYVQAYECFQRAVARAEEVGDSYGRALSLHSLGCFYVAVGAIEKAEEAQQASLRLSRSYRMRQLSHANYVLKGLIFQEQDNLIKAEANLFRALTALAKQGNRWELCHLLVRLAKLHRMGGNLEEAERMGNDALRLSRDLEIDRLRFICQLERGRFLCQRKQFEAGIAAFEEAVAQLSGYSNPEAAAEVFCDLSEAMARCRRLDEARELFAQAVEKAQEVLAGLPAEFRECYRRKHAAWFQETAATHHGEPEEEGELVEETKRLALVTQLTGELASGVLPDEFLRRAIVALTKHMRAECGFLLRVEGDEEVRVIHSSDRSGKALQHPATHIAGELVADVLSDGEPIYSTDTGLHPKTKIYDSVFKRELHAVVVAPLKAGAAVTGIIYLANSSLQLTGPEFATIMGSFVPIFVLGLTTLQAQSTLPQPE